MKDVLGAGKKVTARLAGWIDRMPDQLPIEMFDKYAGFYTVGQATRVERLESGCVAELGMSYPLPGHTVQMAWGPGGEDNASVLILPPGEDDRAPEHQVKPWGEKPAPKPPRVRYGKRHVKMAQNSVNQQR